MGKYTDNEAKGPQKFMSSKKTTTALNCLLLGGFKIAAALGIPGW